MASKIIGVHPCDDDHQVVTIKTSGKDYRYRREPCAECPWRKDRPVGVFPVEAFRHSANTSRDMAQTTFACHMAKTKKSQTCAGFLLSTGAEHNMMIRFALLRGRLSWDEIKSDVELYADYREMAIANGVDPDDPCLEGLR